MHLHGTQATSVQFWVSAPNRWSRTSGDWFLEFDHPGLAESANSAPAADLVAIA